MNYIQTIAIIIVCALVAYNAHRLYQYYKWRTADRIICDFYVIACLNMLAHPKTQDAWWNQGQPICNNFVRYLCRSSINSSQAEHIYKRHMQILKRAFGTSRLPFNKTLVELLMEMEKKTVYSNPHRYAWVHDEQYKAYMVI
jgi:hypothetical protein